MSLMDKAMDKLNRIVAVHDISGFGKCSLTVALPVVSATGVECACMPTALFSTHTGEFTGWTFRDLTDQMLPMARHWHSIGMPIDGIYSGYLASPAQVELLGQVIDQLATEDTLIVCDPAMADNGRYYAGLGDELCGAFRALFSRVHVVTPNITEAALLTGEEYLPAPHSPEYIDRLFNGLARLGPRVAAITGVHPSGDEIGIVVRDFSTGESFAAMSRALDGVFYGTGDIFASAFAALLVRGASAGQALEAASALVRESIVRSYHRDTPRPWGVDFEGALPAYIRRVEAIFDPAP